MIVNEMLRSAQHDKQRSPMPRWLSTLFMLVLVVGIPPFLILSNVFLFMTPNWLDNEYGKPDFPKAQLFNDADRRVLEGAGA